LIGYNLPCPGYLGWYLVITWLSTVLSGLGDKQCKYLSSSYRKTDGQIVQLPDSFEV